MSGATRRPGWRMVYGVLFSVGLGLGVLIMLPTPGCGEGGFTGNIDVPIGNPNTNVNVTTGDTNVTQNQTNTQTQTTSVNVEQHTRIGNDVEKPAVDESGEPVPTPPPPPPPPADLGVLTGTVVNALDGTALADVEIKLMDTEYAVMSDADGLFTINDIPAGDYSAGAFAVGFAVNGQAVQIVGGEVTQITIGLVPLGTGNVTVILTWGPEVDGACRDLDLHLTGPDTADRFHAAYYALNPVPYAFLDLDDVTWEGPETMTIHPQPVDGVDEGTWLFVPGSYHVWVHNYSLTPEYDVSAARVQLFQGDTQMGEYLIGEALGDPAEEIWRVVEFDVTETGVVTNIAPLGSMEAGDQSTEF